MSLSLEFPLKKNYSKFKSVLSLLLVLCAVTLFAQNYYVSSNGSDSNNGLSVTTPFKTIQKAADIVQAGGTVFIMNGTYNRTTYGSVLDFKRNGSPSGYITFKPYPGHNPKISASGGSWNAVVINGSYVILDGLELEGNNANIKLADAEKAFDDAVTGTVGPQAAYNTNAISTGTAHHVIIRNCKVHDFPGGGIGVGPADYVTIENNTVYNNSWFTMYATSGISVFGPKHIDAVTTYKIIIRGNICHNNKTQVKWKTGSGNYKLSDGNGIIIDANNGTQGKVVYTGRTLVENNVSYNNGGSGIHAFQAARVDIINNTAYNNGTMVGYEEIFANSGDDVKILNNIMYARTGGKCTSNYNNKNTVYNYNLYYNGTAAITGPNDLVGNPQFVKLATDNTADFRLKSTSPAINTGSNVAGQYSTKDILGVSRPVGSKPDKGAYEYSVVTEINTVNKTNKNFLLYPNPANNYVILEGVTFPNEIELYDVVGKKVFSQIGTATESYKIDLAELKPGIYFFRVISGNNTQTEKLIKE